MPQDTTSKARSGICPEKGFRAKFGCLVRLTQKALFARAQAVDDPAQKKALLECHAEISGSAQKVIG